MMHYAVVYVEIIIEIKNTNASLFFPKPYGYYLGVVTVATLTVTNKIVKSVSCSYYLPSSKTVRLLFLRV